MKAFRFVLIVFAFLCLLPIESALAGAEPIHDSGTFDIDEIIMNDCTGEEVHLTGTMMWKGIEIFTDSGLHKWGFQIRYQGVKGVGLTSGTIYQFNSGEHGYGTDVPLEESGIPYHYAAGWIQTIRLVSRGSIQNMVVRHHTVVTVSPNGYRVEIYDYEAVCK